METGIMENEPPVKEISAEKNLMADNTIKNFLLGSMGIGLIPLPVIDFIGLTALQVALVKKLSKIYDVAFSKELGKSLICSLVGSATPMLLFKPAASLIKFIPIVGMTVGMVSMPALSGASTYALGKAFKKHFESGGTLLTFNPERMKKYYYEKFKEGKGVASGLKAEATAEKA